MRSHCRSKSPILGAALVVAAVLVTFCTDCSVVRADDGRVPTFEKDVQPILSAKCFRCHGEKTKKADLDLSTVAGIRKGSESGPVIVAGKPSESRLFEMVHEEKM